jgi:hypothetical protein
MNLYKLSQTENIGYDTYDACIVAAESEEAARKMLPNGANIIKGMSTQRLAEIIEWEWADQDKVIVEKIGTADPHITKPQVICSSFNAG